MPDVTCVGVLVADVVGKPIDAMPGRGKLLLADRIELHCGGNAANVGVSLAKLGTQTALIGKVGEDGFGDFLIQSCARAGVETGGVARDSEAATSATIVLGHGDGERSFIHYVGANATLRLEDIDFDRIAASKILHVAGSFILPGIDGAPTVELLRRAQAAGVRTSLDTVWDPKGRWMSLIAPCLPYVDYFAPSYEEARQFAGGAEDPEEIAQILQEAGAKVIGLKLGERGCLIRRADGSSFTVPAYPVTAVDSLGAGDAWVAGFLTGLTKGWELERCARFANAAGACCVQAIGATTGILSFEETLAFMERFAP